MLKPIDRHFDTHRQTSWLYFEDREPIECYMRGGICWPIRYELNGKVETSGYALMAGMDIKTNDIYVFDQIEWVTVDNILGDNNVIRYPGLSHWFNRVWNVYYGRSYYYEQGYELTHRFRLRIIRSKMIEPKPQFIELPPTDTDTIIACIWRVLTTKKPMIYRGKDTMLEKQLQAVREGDNNMFPAVHALGCCLLGMEQFPWREPYQKPIREVLVQ